MHYVIVGGLGYIGSRLTQRLLQLPDQYAAKKITIVDWKFTNEWAERTKEELIRSDPLARIVFREEDYRDLEIEEDIDVLFHLAALVGYPICEQFPTLAWDVNARGLEGRKFPSILNHAKWICSANTNSQYGTVLDGECTEETPTNAISVYAATKCAAEQSLLSHVWKDRTTILRLATVYGKSPKQRKDLLINTYVDDAVRTGLIEVFNPDVWRNYVHVNDVCSAFILSFQKKAAGIFNFGDDELNCTKWEIAKRLGEILNVKVKNCGSMNDPDRRNYKVSSKKFFSIHGPFQFADFEQSIKELAEQYRTKS